MALPFFYISSYEPGARHITLEEDTSKHIIQVLRMKKGESLLLTDGKGHLLTCIITEEHKKHCSVECIEVKKEERSSITKTIAISLLKNTNRFEWFLEKAVELGITSIIPIISERTEKEKFRMDRLQTICVSAMLQSQQSWLTVLEEPVAYKQLLQKQDIVDTPLKFIGHCLESDKQELHEQQINKDAIILIGPEGDFTQEEIDLALQHNFHPVSLGATRLRTETAGMVASVLFTL